MKNIGIVLSGGIAKGAYQIGALRAIGKYVSPEEVKIVSAASVGSLNGYAFFGGDLSIAENLWLGVNDYKKNVNIFTLLKSDYFQGALDKLATLKLSCKRFYVPLFKFSGRKLLYPNLAEVEPRLIKQHLNAAVSFVHPYRMEDGLYLDGALFDNIPVFPLKNEELDYIICVHFDQHNHVFDSPELNSKIIKISFSDDTFLSKSWILNRDNTEKMIALGEEKANSILDFVFKNGTENEAVYEQIRVLDELKGKPKLRLTTDTVLNNINKFSKHLAKRNYKA